MKIAFLTRKDPSDKGAWSGAFYKMYSELQIHNEIEWVKPEKRSFLSKAKLTSLALWYKVTGHRSLNVINDYYAKSTTKDLLVKFKKNRYDVIFAAASPELFAYLNIDVPIVYFLDATFLQLSKDYPAFSNLPKWNFRQAMAIECRALKRADSIIVTSEWAKNSIISDYKVNAGKISIFSFGANMDIVPTSEEAKALIQKRTDQKEFFKVLFIGKNWKRKGGDLALQTVLQLNKEGLKTYMTILGTVPPDIPHQYQSFFNVIPHLDKNSPKDFHQLYELFKDSHLMLLPTRADCTPIVFSEAAAFGLPVITTDTGGVGDVVTHGLTGKVLKYNDSVEEYVEAIKDLHMDREKYKMFSQNSRDRYEDELNWKTWSTKTEKILTRSINKDK